MEVINIKEHIFLTNIPVRKEGTFIQICIRGGFYVK